MRNLMRILWDGLPVFRSKKGVEITMKYNPETGYAITTKRIGRVNLKSPEVRELIDYLTTEGKKFFEDPPLPPNAKIKIKYTID